MPKEIVLSPDSDPKSSKYIVWQMDEDETHQIKLAIGKEEDRFPLLSTLSDYHEDFMCEGDRLLALCEETINLEISLEEQRHETRVLIKLLTMIGGLAALGHNYRLNLYAYGD